MRFDLELCLCGLIGIVFMWFDLNCVYVVWFGIVFMWFDFNILCWNKTSWI